MHACEVASKVQKTIKRSDPALKRKLVCKSECCTKSKLGMLVPYKFLCVSLTDSSRWFETNTCEMLHYPIAFNHWKIITNLCNQCLHQLLLLFILTLISFSNKGHTLICVLFSRYHGLGLVMPY